MKKAIALTICILAMFSMLAVSASAAKKEPFLPEDDKTGYPITGISDSYSRDQNVEKVTIPENIVHLGDHAFYACKNLAQIKLHNKIQRIGKQAFEETAYYENPENWIDGVLYIGNALIKADPNKISEEYHVKPGTRLIADGAFEGCTKLSVITLPETVEYVGTDAFSETELVKNQENKSDKNLIIDHVLITADKDFIGTFSIPDGIKTIADNAFAHAKITKVITPDSLKYIGLNAFLDCKQLSEVYLGKSVKTLGRGPFRLCTNLQTINVHKDNEYFTVIDGVLYDHQLSSVIRCAQKTTGPITLPNSVTKIHAYAFEHCTKLIGVEIPDGCLFVGNSAFYLCENLIDIVLPETMEYIDNNAFSFCKNLNSIIIPNSVYYLGKNAFYHCYNLETVKIGDGVEELQDGLFEYCKELNTIELGSTIKRIDKTAFLFTKYIENVLNYQNGLLIASNKYLIKVAKDVTTCRIPDGISIIADGAFEYASDPNQLCKIYVPSSIKKFNWGAFSEIPKTTPIYYDGSIKSFSAKTNFDWDCVNLYTTDYTSSVWAIIFLSGILSLLIISITVINYRNKKQNMSVELEEQNEK